MIRKTVRAAFAFSAGWFLSLLMQSTGYAVPFPAFTGHTENLNSVVNFAVLPPGDPFINVLSPLFRPGASASTQLNPHQFTYLYQVTNYGGSTPFSDITELSFRPRGSTTAMGSFAAAGLRAEFVDQARLVDATGRLSTVSSLISGCMFPYCTGDGPGGNLDGAKGFGIAVTQDPAQQVKVYADGKGLGNGNSLSWRFSGFSGGLTSPVFGYQSYDGPGLALANERVRGGVGETLILPVAEAPEPGTLLIIGSGLMGLVWWRSGRPLGSHIATADVVGTRE
jgi:hypothetical protein